MEQEINIACTQILPSLISLSKTNPSQISGILKNLYPKLTTQESFIHHHLSLIFSTEDFEPCLEDLSSSAQQFQSICAKTLVSSDVAWKWEDWELDPTCIICMEWFEKSNHEGHRVKLQRGAAGWWDCGDVTAWKPSGFCTDHQGYREYTDEEVEELMPEGVGKRSQVVFDTMGGYLADLWAQWEIIDNARVTAKEKEVQKMEKQKDGYIEKIVYWLELLKMLLETSPLFIHYTMKILEKVYPLDLPETHQWSILAYVDEKHRSVCEEVVLQTSEDTEKKKCHCTLLALIMRVKDKRLYDLFCNSIIFKMFQSLRFKNLLGLTYVSVYESLMDDCTEDNQYSHLGVQILTIPEVSIKILQHSELSKLFSLLEFNLIL